MEDLKSEEKELTGMWLDLGSKLVGDAVYDRIEWLAHNRLELLKTSEDSLRRLYRDPSDGRLWLHSIPFKGGPPQLKTVSAEEAQTII